MHPVGLHRRGEVDLTQIIESFSKHPQSRRAGAIASFIGVVREDPVREESGKVSHLEYEAYEEVALKRLEEIRRSMLSRPGIVEVSIHHIIDRLGVGEASLYVAVLGGHRQEVFPVLSETVERVKKEVPIWKKEYTTKSAYWVSTDHTQDQ
ncbi:MAG: molybdenum cofactor biosynthesis protein MoaE [Candidatus Bathyarchaeia archaeon]|jgi:molybdopterin synthase catalytic subunit